jgi:hypothetical protein
MFVISVELLDNAMLECTLTADSTGRNDEDEFHLFLAISSFFALSSCRLPPWALDIPWSVFGLAVPLVRSHLG